MNNTTKNNASGGFLTGFLLGLFIGGGFVFLFATKTGKRLLKVISEEGFDKVSKLDEFLEELSEEDLEDEVEEKPKLPGKSLQEPVVNAYTKPVDIHPSESVAPVDTVPTVSVVQSTPSKPRRFFKRVPRKH